VTNPWDVGIHPTVRLFPSSHAAALEVRYLDLVAARVRDRVPRDHEAAQLVADRAIHV